MPSKRESEPDTKFISYKWKHWFISMAICLMAALIASVCITNTVYDEGCGSVSASSSAVGYTDSILREDDNMKKYIPRFARDIGFVSKDSIPVETDISDTDISDVDISVMGITDASDKIEYFTDRLYRLYNTRNFKISDAKIVSVKYSITQAESEYQGKIGNKDIPCIKIGQKWYVCTA